MSRSRTSWRRPAVATLGTAALLSTVAVPAGAAPPDDLGGADDVGISVVTDTFMPSDTSPTGAWFVELEGDPTAAGGSLSTMSSSADDFEATAADLGIEFDLRETFTTLWNGLAIDATDEDAATLAQSDQVVAIYPVLEIEAPVSPEATVPDMESALAMTGADVAQSELGFTGEGVKIGIIDSGVDYDHPDLGGDGTSDGDNFPNDKVVAGYDFVGDSYNADSSNPDYQPIPEPDAFPDDCGGHGTHVAGIAAGDGDPAQDGVRGVAPAAQIGAYRVFGCEGSTTADVMLSALEQALADGMDVVNQSIGSTFQWPQYPTAVASDNLVDAGVVMVASIGNSGASGLFAAGAPGVGEKVIGVASFDNTIVKTPMLRVDGAEYGFTSATGAAPTPIDGTLPVVPTGEPGSAGAQACTPDAIESDVVGAAALLQRGVCSFAEKAVAAQEAGASAVLMYNNAPGLLNPTVEGDTEITIPVVMISLDDGLAAYEAASAESGATLEWTDEVVDIANPTGGLISAFSSYGLANDLSLKPDIGAPGGSIWSTLPLEQGSYGSNSGTSMSSPHVAGAAALYLQAHPDAGAETVRSALLNTSDPNVFSGNPALGLLESVNRQGAGMLDIDGAIGESTTISPVKLSLGESEAGPVTETVTVTNNGTAPVTYDLSFEDAVATGQNPANGDSADVPGFYVADSTVQMPESITVNPGQEVSFDVSIAPAADYDLVHYGGYLYLSSGDEQLSIPFAGFAGDYQSLPVLTPGDFGLPALATLTECEILREGECAAGGSWALAEAGAVYSLADGNLPTLLVHLDAPVENLRVDIYKANEDGTRGEPVNARNYTYMESDYVGRTGGGPNVFLPIAWDGTRIVGDSEREVRDGDYILTVSVVKALGDPENPDHVESVDSVNFTIDRDGDGNPPPPTIWELLVKLVGIALAKILCVILGYCSAP